MDRRKPTFVLRFAGFMLVCAFALTRAAAKPEKRPEPVLFVVMDPLAKEMACACVKGYAQRDYRKLAARLEKEIKQQFVIEFSDDLAESLAGLAPGREVMVVGDQSLVAAGARTAKLKCHPICELSDQEGLTTLGGLFVAPADDSAKSLREIAGRTVLFGVPESDVKYASAEAALSAAGVKDSINAQKRPTYNEAVLDMLDSPASPPPVAVIPAYALRLLEGCGTVKPGGLRVIGKTEPVPFIALFLADSISPEKEQKMLKTLLEVKGNAKLLKALESRSGFRPIKSASSESRTSAEWPDWRGPERDGHVPKLPARLPERAKVVWKKGAMAGGLAGLSVSDGRLILAERDLGDENDLYRCLNADTGELLWRMEFPARGRLDYGQFPRATPVIHEGKAYLLGAFGELRCVNLTNGKVVWKRQLPREFKAKLPTWGMCSTPLIVGDLLIVNPGATNASLAALDCATGRTRWTTPGNPAAYSSFVRREVGGRQQIVGYDQYSLGGWDAKTGERLWQLVPPKSGDFNVPTPVPVEGGVLVSTENNGTRLYKFDASGRIIPSPAAEFTELAPETMTPIVTCGKVFGTNHGLHCLDTRQSLKPLWFRENDPVGDHATFIADDERVLVITLAGELVLLEANPNECAITSRLRIFDEEVEVFSHPAMVGSRLYVRGGSSVMCVDLATTL